MKKTYYVNGRILTFDVIEEGEVKVPVWYAKCRENGKMAWLDNHGIQFEGEQRFAASTEEIKEEEDIEHLDIMINWCTLTQKEQNTLHALLCKAHI